MMRRLLAALRSRPSRMSADWLRAQDRLMARIDYHGVAVQWPINKALNEASAFQTARLRRDAERRRA